MLKIKINKNNEVLKFASEKEAGDYIKKLDKII